MIEKIAWNRSGLTLAVSLLVWGALWAQKPSAVVVHTDLDVLWVKDSLYQAKFSVANRSDMLKYEGSWIGQRFVELGHQSLWEMGQGRQLALGTLYRWMDSSTGTPFEWRFQEQWSWRGSHFNTRFRLEQRLFKARQKLRFRYRMSRPLFQKNIQAHAEGLWSMERDRIPIYGFRATLAHNQKISPSFRWRTSVQYRLSDLRAARISQWFLLLDGSLRF